MSSLRTFTWILVFIFIKSTKKWFDKLTWIYITIYSWINIYFEFKVVDDILLILEAEGSINSLSVNLLFFIGVDDPLFIFKDNISKSFNESFFLLEQFGSLEFGEIHIKGTCKRKK